MASISGSAMLKELDKGLASLRRDVRSLDSDIADSSQQVRSLGEAKLLFYRKLAEHRLEKLEQGGLLQGLDSVSQNVVELLDRRERAHGELLGEIRGEEERLEALEVKRTQLSDEAEAAALQLDEAEAEVQNRLEEDPAYRTQLEHAHRADAIADEAEAKTRDATDDKKSKGEPYEADHLFMYLWNRHYGTSEYSANPLTRMLDRWVAKLCNYDKARPNYWMLNEIPLRLQAHAEAARSRADAEFQELEKLETDAAGQMGLPRLNEVLDEREQALEACDESITAAEQRLAQLSDQRSQFASGRDPLMMQALDRLADEMKSEGIQVLRRRAAETPDREDDRIVAEIIDTDERLEMLEEEHRDRQKIYRRQDQKVRDLSALRQQFKRRGYDDMRSMFVNGAALTGALQQFLGGLLDDEDLWRLIARSQRLRKVRARPEFGSGGFPRRPGTWRLPRQGSNWGLPPIGGSRGGFRIPSGGGFRFPSGGGIGRSGGGGGFSTGGRF
jgi:hypothetical protein